MTSGTRHAAEDGTRHPGPEATCTRSPCSTDYRAPMRRTFPAGGHGELYCPWCSAALVQAELSPVEVAAAHVRENGHTGRPVQVNRALRLAAESLAATEEGRTGG